MEQWKEIAGYEGVYEISSYGNARSVNRIRPNRHGEMKTYKGKILRNCISSKGYPQIHLSKNNVHRTLEIHRLVAKAFIPNTENKNCINHIDGNPKNNHISNLEWCTYSENNLHANRTGLRTSQKGEKNTQSKLTENQVLAIRELSLLGMSQRKLGKLFNVSHTVIRQIQLRNKWKHV